MCFPEYKQAWYCQKVKVIMYLEYGDQDNNGGSCNKQVPASQHAGTEFEPTNQIAAQQHS
jgi:hypothetical protein